MLPLKFIEKTYKYKTTLNEAIEKQEKLKELNKLNNYGPRIFKKIEFQNLQTNCLMREMILIFLKKGLFRIKKMYLKEKKKNQKKNQQRKKQKLFQIY